MIEWLVNRIFSWNSLREAVTDEVHFYDQLKKAISDPRPGSLFWREVDGWRSWTYEPELKKYYFNDIPEGTASSALNEVYLMDVRSMSVEFDLDEIW
jgi:hypothetical protein